MTHLVMYYDQFCGQNRKIKLYPLNLNKDNTNKNIKPKTVMIYNLIYSAILGNSFIKINMIF